MGMPCDVSQLNGTCPCRIGRMRACLFVSFGLYVVHVMNVCVISASVSRDNIEYAHLSYYISRVSRVEHDLTPNLDLIAPSSQNRNRRSSFGYYAS